jgi:hypothetical protein
MYEVVVCSVITTWISWRSSPSPTSPLLPLHQRLFVWNHYNSPARLLSLAPLWTVHTSQFRPLGKTELDTMFYIFIILAERISVHYCPRFYIYCPYKSRYNNICLVSYTKKYTVRLRIMWIWKCPRTVQKQNYTTKYRQEKLWYDVLPTVSIVFHQSSVNGFQRRTIYLFLLPNLLLY